MKIIRGAQIKYTGAGHEDPKNPKALKKVLFKKDDLIDGRMQMINWAKIPVGKTFRSHYHEDMDEVFIIIRGKAKIFIEKEEEILEEGDAVLIPMKHIHKMANIDSKDLEYIALGISTQKNGKTIVVKES